MNGDDDMGESLRVDLLLWRLRFCKSRSLATKFVQNSAIRLNNRRILRASQPVRAQDVVTMPRGKEIIAFSIESLPQRRGSAPEARGHYTLI